MFDLIANYLAWLYSLTNSYGGAIMLLTLTVMIVVTPLTLSGTKSMMQMQRLQPEMKEIQAKHKDDREKLNQEMMAFYQENGINPVGGCLPLFIQAPVFYVLYRVVGGLTRRVADTGESIGGLAVGNADGALPTETLNFTQNFNPEYLDTSSQMYQDLASSDEMPFLGVDLANSALDALRGSIVEGLPYLLTIVIVLVTSLYQQKQIKGRSSTTAAVNPQQETIMKILPWFLPVISFGLQAALVLYFIVSNLYRIGQQSYITRTLYGDTNDAPASTKAGATASATSSKKTNGSNKNRSATSNKSKKQDPKSSSRTTAAKPKSSNGRRSSGGRTTPKGASSSTRQGPRREGAIEPRPRKKKGK